MTITRNIKIVFCLLMFPFCCAMAQEEYTWEMEESLEEVFIWEMQIAAPRLKTQV